MQQKSLTFHVTVIGFVCSLNGGAQVANKMTQ